jgi:hypothetical protein
MQHAENNAKEALAAIARVREIGIERADLVRDWLRSVLAGNSHFDSSFMPAAEFAGKIADNINSAAEQRYLADVRKIAMDLMEHDRSLTATEAMAWAESMILDAVIS